MNKNWEKKSNSTLHQILKLFWQLEKPPPLIIPWRLKSNKIMIRAANFHSLRMRQTGPACTHFIFYWDPGKAAISAPDYFQAKPDFWLLPKLHLGHSGFRSSSYHCFNGLLSLFFILVLIFFVLHLLSKSHFYLFFIQVFQNVTQRTSCIKT